ncbi:MAG: diguanylate cyclase, partial [Pseudomonadales bacterium]|nr:diguanylate cyclase [Pseudomonadales bacterium]
MLHLEKQEQDIVGRSFYDLSPKVLLAERKRYISEAVESRRLVKFEEDNGDMIYDVHLCPILNTLEDKQLETDTLEKITRVAIFSRDITVERNHERELVQLANFDHLTGLNNRTFFNSYQKALLKQAKRNKRPIATLFLDLDHFKEINDTWGHDTGDKLLKSVAHRLLACTREGDLVARLGGDEFAILLIDIKHPDQAAIVAQKLLDSFAKPHQLEGHEIFSGCSVGIACYPECGSNPEEMNKAADAAMYQAKRQGRNRYCFYDPALQEHNLNKAFLVNALRQALQNNEISVLYQIKVKSSSKEIAGVEALARWNHSERGSIPPSVFIPLAEEFGLISDIGEWVLRTACTDIKQLQNQFGFDNCLKISVAVNVSPRQLKDLDFSEKVKNVLN